MYPSSHTSLINSLQPMVKTFLEMPSLSMEDQQRYAHVGSYMMYLHEQ